MTGVAVDTPAGAREAGQPLRGRGARHVHMRLRGGGCISLGPDGGAALRAPQDLRAVDTTGAGDAFAGTLASVLAVRLELVEAIRRAVAAAACAVTRFGPQESYPDPATLDAMMRPVHVVG